MTETTPTPDQTLFALTRLTLEQVATDLDPTERGFTWLQDKTIADILECNRLLRSLEQSAPQDSASDLNQQHRILLMIKHTLAAVAKDTAIKPEFQHPLQPATLENMRQCFALLSQQQQEILALQGRVAPMRPHFVDETPPPSEATPQAVAVPLFHRPKPKKP